MYEQYDFEEYTLSLYAVRNVGETLQIWQDATVTIQSAIAGVDDFKKLLQHRYLNEMDTLYIGVSYKLHSSIYYGKG